MNARIALLMVLAWLVMLPTVYGQEAQAPPAQQRLRRAQPADRPVTTAPGALVTLDVLMIDHKIAGAEKDRGNLHTAAELLELEKQGKLEHVLRVRLSSVEQSKASVQLGERVPVATARTVGGFGRGGPAAEGRPTSYSYSLENIGTLISAAARVEEGGTVIVDLQVERSQMAATERPADDIPDAVGRQKTVSLTCQSSLRLKPGEPTLANASQTTEDGATTGQFIVVTATVDAQGAGRAAAVDRDREMHVRIFNLRNAKADAMAQLLARTLGDKPIRVGVDEATNALVVASTRDQLEVVEQLLQQLDVGEK
ncbi:MAG: secretin N-terminal domain-containing protein [Pirellulales bacterium]